MREVGFHSKVLCMYVLCYQTAYPTGSVLPPHHFSYCNRQKMSDFESKQRQIIIVGRNMYACRRWPCVDVINFLRGREITCVKTGFHVIQDGGPISRRAKISAILTGSRRTTSATGAVIGAYLLCALHSLVGLIITGLILWVSTAVSDHHLSSQERRGPSMESWQVSEAEKVTSSVLVSAYICNNSRQIHYYYALW